MTAILEAARCRPRERVRENFEFYCEEYISDTVRGIENETYVGYNNFKPREVARRSQQQNSVEFKRRVLPRGSTSRFSFPARH